MVERIEQAPALNGPESGGVMATGITRRHSRSCRSREGGRCNCNAGWEAWVYLPRQGTKVRKTFQREAEAKTWRADAVAAANRGALRRHHETGARSPRRFGLSWTT